MKRVRAAPLSPVVGRSDCANCGRLTIIAEEEEEEEELRLFVFNDTVEGPRAPAVAVKPGRVTAD